MTANDRPLGEFVGGHYRIASLSPDEAPSVVLDGQFLRNLAPVLQAACARAVTLTPGQPVEAVRDLCERLLPLLRHHEQATREWLASRPLSEDLRTAQAEIDELRRMLDAWR